MVKCQHACPVHTNACGYVTAIAEGRYEDAYRIARATNPFASICGRVCGAPCEVNCRRGDVDEPVSIRALKRFVTDKFGPEAGDSRHASCRLRPAHAAAQSRRLRTHRRRRRRRLRPDGGARPRADRLQGHRLRSECGAGRHADRRRAGVPPAPRTGESGDRRHPLAGRRTQVQHAAGPRFHHRRPAPRWLQGDLPRHRPAQGPQADPARAETGRWSTTAWTSCAPSTKASRCRSAGASW